MTASHVHFDFARLTQREKYKVLIGTVMPRPIAFVTTVSPEGIANAGAFSFFNILTHDPAILAIGIENYEDMRLKDTARNIRETGEFTVHIADDALVAQMEICSIKFGPEVDELATAGLVTVPGTMVKSPRIVAAPAALECRRFTTMEVGRARQIVMGEVVGAFVREDAVDATTLHIDPGRIDAIGRLAAHGYARTRDRYDLKTPTVAEWEEHPAGGPAQRRATA
ncbi:MAG: flavin reductase family protein [Bauldia sp.]